MILPHTHSKFFVAIAGNIGVGKSTLTGILAEAFGWKPFYEAVDENPYLAGLLRRHDALELPFAGLFSRRLQHHRQLVDHPGSVVQDRSVRGRRDLSPVTSTSRPAFPARLSRLSGSSTRRARLPALARPAGLPAGRVTRAEPHPPARPRPSARSRPTTCTASTCSTRPDRALGVLPVPIAADELTSSTTPMPATSSSRASAGACIRPASTTGPAHPVRRAR